MYHILYKTSHRYWHQKYRWRNDRPTTPYAERCHSWGCKIVHKFGKFLNILTAAQEKTFLCAENFFLSLNRDSKVSPEFA